MNKELCDILYRIVNNKATVNDFLLSRVLIQNQLGIEMPQLTLSKRVNLKGKKYYPLPAVKRPPYIIAKVKGTTLTDLPSDAMKEVMGYFEKPKELFEYVLTCKNIRDSMYQLGGGMSENVIFTVAQKQPSPLKLTECKHLIQITTLRITEKSDPDLVLQLLPKLLGLKKLIIYEDRREKYSDVKWQDQLKYIEKLIEINNNGVVIGDKKYDIKIKKLEYGGEGSSRSFNQEHPTHKKLLNNIKSFKHLEDLKIYRVPILGIPGYTSNPIVDEIEMPAKLKNLDINQGLSLLKLPQSLISIKLTYEFINYIKISQLNLPNSLKKMEIIIEHGVYSTKPIMPPESFSKLPNLKYLKVQTKTDTDTNYFTMYKPLFNNIPDNLDTLDIIEFHNFDFSELKRAKKLRVINAKIYQEITGKIDNFPNLEVLNIHYIPYSNYSSASSGTVVISDLPSLNELELINDYKIRETSDNIYNKHIELKMSLENRRKITKLTVDSDFPFGERNSYFPRLKELRVFIKPEVKMHMLFTSITTLFNETLETLEINEIHTLFSDDMDKKIFSYFASMILAIRHLKKLRTVKFGEFLIDFEEPPLLKPIIFNVPDSVKDGRSILIALVGIYADKVELKLIKKAKYTYEEDNFFKMGDHFYNNVNETVSYMNKRAEDEIERQMSKVFEYV